MKQFKQVFIDYPGHFIIEDLRKDKAEVFDQEIANHLISSIIDILSKKLPQDVNFNNAKLESVVSKIRLVPVPKADSTITIEINPTNKTVKHNLTLFMRFIKTLLISHL